MSVTTETAAHEAAVSRVVGRYPFKATCPCGWESRGYLAAHAAQIMADDHAEVKS